MSEYAQPAWTLPSSWREVVPDAGQMMKASPKWKIPSAPGDRAETTLHAYGIPEGSTITESWPKEIGGASLRRSEEKVGGQAVTIFEGTGQGRGILAAVVTLNRPFRTINTYTLCTRYVFEVVGPEKTVVAARQDFLALVRSIQP